MLIDSVMAEVKKFLTELEKKIIAGNYSVIKRDENTVTIKADEIVTVWMSAPERAGLFRVELGRDHFYPPGLLFNAPEKVHSILAKLSEEEINAIKEQRRETLKQLRELMAASKRPIPYAKKIREG